MRRDPITGSGSVVLLAAVPMHDVGGGSRGAQLALELLRRGYHVTYVALYGTAESLDLGIRFIHPRLELYRADELEVGALVSRVGLPQRLAIVELPAPEYLGPVQQLSRSGYTIVYDLIDDWSASSLGGRWYRPEVEGRFIEPAAALVASAPSLVEWLQARSGRPVTLVPNGVNAALFGGDPGPVPSDLPPGEGPLFGYHGSLYGDWFDWEALAEVATTFPEARLVVIGDHRDQQPAMPANVTLLGLKPQKDLPAYLARMDVGLLPFRVTETTQAVSPLKVYEYLASGVPVAAPPLAPLENLEGVYLSDRLAEAVRAALDGSPPDRSEALRDHSWGARLQRLFGAARQELASETAEEVRVVVRPAVHYRRRERWVTASPPPPGSTPRTRR